MSLANWINAHQMLVAVAIVLMTLLCCRWLSGKAYVKTVSLIGVLLWSIAIIYKTLLVRSINESAKFCVVPFLSYLNSFTGNWGTLEQIILNIILFIPLGCFIKLGNVPFGFGVVLALFVEISQLVFHLGYCEIDDIISNTIGTLLGYVYVKRISTTQRRKT